MEEMKKKKKGEERHDTREKSKSKTKVKRVDVLNLKVCFSVCLAPFCEESCLPFQTVVPGMLILGAVLEIHEYMVVFSLPFNMRGTVVISDVSDHVTELVESEAKRLDAEQVMEEEMVSENQKDVKIILLEISLSFSRMLQRFVRFPLWRSCLQWDS